MRSHVMVHTTVMLAALSSFVVAGCAQQPSSNHSSSAGTTAQVVHVVASDWKWTLDKTTFSAGQPIEIDITSQEGVHGFSIDGSPSARRWHRVRTCKWIGRLPNREPTPFGVISFVVRGTTTCIRRSR